MTEISGKVAFITGAASGLGLSMAKSFAARGAKLMLSDWNESGLAEAEASLRAAGADVASIPCDVRDLSQIQAAADATLSAFGKVHIVANNAGVAIGGMPGKIPAEDWRWIVDINLMGVAYGVEVFTPLIKGHGEGGHFMNTASMAGHAAMPGMGPYHATKFAVVGYSEALRLELKRDNIGVSVLCPAWVKTQIHTTGFDRPSGMNKRENAATDPEFLQMEAVIKGGLDSDAVGEWVSECIEANRLYIFTHADFIPGLEGRFASILKDYKAIEDDGRFNP